MRLPLIFLLMFSCFAYGQEVYPNKLPLWSKDQNAWNHNCWETFTPAGYNIYLLQITLKTNAKAIELKNRLRQSGIKAYTLINTTKDGDRFRVRVGPFTSRQEAEKMRSRVKKIGLNDNAQETYTFANGDEYLGE